MNVVASTVVGILCLGSLVAQEPPAIGSSLAGPARNTLQREIEVAALERSKLSAADVVAKVRALEKDAVIVEMEVRLAGVSAVAVWDVDYWTPAKKVKLRIDAASGEVRSTKSKDIGAKNLEDRSRVVAAKVNVERVLARTRERFPAAKISDLDVEVSGGAVEYVLRLIEATGTRKFEIEADGDEKDEAQPLCGRAFIFENTPIGKAAEGWRAAFTGEGGAASWSVASGAGPMAGNRFLTMTGVASPSKTFNLAFAPVEALADIDIASSVRANEGSEDQGGGVFWRAKDEKNYYVCRLNPLESNFRVYRVVDGVREQLGSAACEAKTGEWREIRAVMTGTKIVCMVDGKVLLEVEDGTFPEKGLAGLWTKADAATSFDNVVLSPAVKK